VFLTAQPNVSSKFICNNFANLFEHLELLTKSENYFPKREGIVLIYNILSIPMHVEALYKFCCGTDNIKLVMTFLLDPKQSIKYSAINLFALIVNCSVEKSLEHNLNILKHNKPMLVELLISLFPEKEDIEFQKRRKRMIELIKELK
jgi:Mo25-like